jgi:hypothetical protein
MLPTSAHRPSAVSDGSGGIYLGWLSTPPFNQPVSILVVHLGPSNTGAGGWPLGPRSFGLPADPGFTVSAFGLDAVPGGGLWLAWQTVVPVMGADTPGELRALRLTSAGLPAGGWSAEGVLLAPYDPAFNCASGWFSPVRASQVAVSSDGGPGAFVVASRGSCEGGSFTVFNSLRHLGTLGEPATGWSPDGVDLGNNYSGDIPDPGADGSLRALSDQKGGVFAGLPMFGSEFLAMMTFSRRSWSGASLPGAVGADQRGIEFAPRGDGGMFIASFKPSGATGPYEADAHVAVSQSDPGAGFYESKPSYYSTRYGDIGLTSTGDGGAIFAWSQLIDRQGVYAIRLEQAGMVTGVPPATVVGPPSLRVRFVRGEGVHAVATFAGSPRMTLSLHDLAGRRVSSLRSDATLGADVLLPGTRDLQGGVYFARGIVGGAQELHARVIVLP